MIKLINVFFSLSIYLFYSAWIYYFLAFYSCSQLYLFLSFFNTPYLCSSCYMFLFLFLFLICSYHKIHNTILLLLPVLWLLSFIWGTCEMGNAFIDCWCLYYIMDLIFFMLYSVERAPWNWSFLVCISLCYPDSSLYPYRTSHNMGVGSGLDPSC